MHNNLHATNKFHMCCVLCLNFVFLRRSSSDASDYALISNFSLFVPSSVSSFFLCIYSVPSLDRVIRPSSELIGSVSIPISSLLSSLNQEIIYRPTNTINNTMNDQLKIRRTHCAVKATHVQEAQTTPRTMAGMKLLVVTRPK